MTWLGKAVGDRRGPVRLLPLVIGPGYLLLVQAAQPTAADWAFALAAGLAFLPGGYWPLPVLLVESVLLVAAHPMADALPVVGKVTAGVALVELAARRPPAVAVPGALPLVAAYVLVQVAGHDSADAMGIGYRLVVMVAAPLLLGCWLRAASQALAQAQARAREAEERRELAALGARLAERGELARELHDLVAHHVASMALRVGVAREVLPDLDPRVRAVLDDVHGSATTALVDLRRLVAVLRDPASVTDPTRSLLVEPAELPAAIASVVERAERHGLVLESRIAPGVAELDALRGLAVLRVVQEGLTNVAKHAGIGTRTTVSVASRDGVTEIEIRDAGDGTPTPERLLVKSGYGLEGLRERVALLGGTVEAGPDGRGWCLRAAVPAAPGERLADGLPEAAGPAPCRWTPAWGAASGAGARPDGDARPDGPDGPAGRRGRRVGSFGGAARRA
ncbi:histidine kinase [Streptomyces sp. DSM 44915]|uniref:histidine kinase n=1 Tax=Streptomyces chisholmiae TaxID=3075540 RepID=A0ABU2JPE2_9ACTN|nr:histidine kinase [Streptomyces sp. DSM 44915]MDT0266860.1 histidine kinase [Streptomyces sp. DSM 44915]